MERLCRFLQFEILDLDLTQLVHERNPFLKAIDDLFSQDFKSLAAVDVDLDSVVWRLVETDVND